MSRLRMATMAAGVVVLFGAVASAGRRSDSVSVFVNKNSDGSGSASGAAGTARNSSDNSQQIRCFHYPNNSTCQAWDASGKFIACSTTDPPMMAVLRTFGTDSYLYFYVERDGKCGNVQVMNDSAYPPKAH